ncbi:PAS domain-containing sensor histidine kinase [Leptospira montravelensis]|uniref:histidine kinase n=1 Tax=Leptospira montravelensis TaxID=2484961 RepID=A0ABY2LS61_9LEPT|nr:ATP-binding protein [Leptospira montravelensis]TGK80489.1 PAS domain-containing sensor histidine kinase [Leptospira montravelensis]TGL00666.1 PAS domain-containing sensor histidine kinase [Leptospira montravelensis]
MFNSKIERLSQLLSHSQKGLVFVDLKSKQILYINSIAIEQLEIKNPKSLQVENIFCDFDLLVSEIHTHPQSKSEYKWFLKKLNSEKIPVSVHYSSLTDFFDSDTEIYAITINWNQMHSEDHLEIVDHLEIPFIQTDLAGNLQYANNRFIELFRLSPNKIESYTIFDVLILPENLKNEILKRNTKFLIEVDHSVENSITFQLQSFITMQEGKPNGISLLLLDLSELQNAERIIKYGEDKLRTFFATMNNGFVIINKDAQILEIAPIFKFLLFQVFAFEVGEDIFHFFDEKMKSKLMEVLSSVIENQNSQTTEFDYLLLGEEKTFEIRFIPVRRYDPNDKKILLVFSDITEAKRKDRQLIESMKFASIGEIAAGLAHEINNPLQSALLYLDDLITVDEADQNERRNILKKIESANLRIRDLVKALLDLGRMESPNRDIVSPYYILVRTSELVEVSCRKKNISFTRHAGPNLPGIFVRWQEIEQVLINCVVNSINALSEMETARQFPKIELGIDLVKIQKKEWVVFSVEDNGPGIDDDTLEKVFLPLFTTRRNKQGTGLGLSISKKIIAEHGGEIYIKTKEGTGAKVEIYLPAHTDENG